MSRAPVGRTTITLPHVSKVGVAPVLIDGRVDGKGPVVQYLAFEIARLRSGAVAAVGINPDLVGVGVEFHVELVGDIYMGEWGVSIETET